MSDLGLKYIVYAPSFNNNSGGAIFMHELVNALNSLGEEAYIWPMAPIYKPSRLERIKRWISPPAFARDPNLNTPLAQKSNLDDRAIVVYPELVPGNPLNAGKVVRWLLYRPGIMHPYDFTEGEMFFRVFEKADVPELTGGAPELFLWKINPHYRNEGRSDRKGVCYILRKGSYKPRIPETEVGDAIRIDNLSHGETNDIFNRCGTFYSYDEATMYSQFAAICGCVSIVIPGEHVSRADWVHNHELGQYGVAYGLDEAEIEHARTTRKQLIKLLNEKEREGLETVKRFVILTKKRFQNV